MNQIWAARRGVRVVLDLKEGGLAIGNRDSNRVFVSREEFRVEVGVLSAKKGKGIGLHFAEMGQL
ncbi:hypothetical protein AKJ16_DCAP21445 [Drosera capensis]